MPRFYCPFSLQAYAHQVALELPPSVSKHVQVLRMQPGMMLTLFDGLGGEYSAKIEQMSRSSVLVKLHGHAAIEREAKPDVHLALGVPANERMDWLVEKATELGVCSIWPLMTERNVLRLAGERAQKKQAHWQAIAASACEQSGRNRVPLIHPVQNLSTYLQSQTACEWPKDAPPPVCRLMLSFAKPQTHLLQALSGMAERAQIHVLSGAEGGLSSGEERLALAQGWQPVSLGARVLRAETAALATLAALVLHCSDLA